MPENIDKIKKVKRQHEKAWMSLKQVVAVGIGQTSVGETGILVAVRKDPDKIRAQIPEMIKGIRVEIQQIGEIKAL